MQIMALSALSTTSNIIYKLGAMPASLSILEANFDNFYFSISTPDKSVSVLQRILSSCLCILTLLLTAHLYPPLLIL